MAPFHRPHVLYFGRPPHARTARAKALAEARAAETKAKAAAKVAPARPDAGPKDYDWDGGYNVHTHINSI